MSVTRGIVGCWSPSLGASGYLLRDVSGRNNHGTLTNMDPGTDWVPSERGLVLDYDGSNDAVVMGSIPIKTSMAATAWINIRAMSGTMTVLGDCNLGGNTQDYFLEVNRTSNKVSVLWGNAVIQTDTRDLAINRWYLIGFTRFGAASAWSINIYVDGVAGSTGTTGANPNGGSGTSIGKGGQLDALYFNGRIGEAALWDRPLNDSEHAELYRRGNGWLGRELTGMNQRRTYGKKPGIIPSGQNVTTRLTLIGTSRQRQTIDGTSGERLAACGTSGRRLSIEGSST